MKLIIIFAVMSLFAVGVKQESKLTERKVKTVYSTSGRAINQSQHAKGWHRVAGQVKLSSGKATVVLNTSTANGKQNIRFISGSTYRVTVWSLDTSSTNTYRGFPLSGASFMVRSSDTGDATTISYIAEGE